MQCGTSYHMHSSAVPLAMQRHDANLIIIVRIVPLLLLLLLLRPAAGRCCLLRPPAAWCLKSPFC
jgi:hypothetical protein